MILFGRKFFYGLILILPLLACALPNFAALAPTALPPSPTPTSASAEIVATPSAVSSGQGAALEPPQVAESIDQLPPVSINTSVNTAQDQIEIYLGVPYQINQNVTLKHIPPPSQSILFSATGGAKLKIMREAQQTIDDLIEIETPLKNYYLIPLTQPDDMYQVEIALQEESIIEADFFFGWPPERVFTPGDVPENDVARIEFDATAHRPILIEMRSSILLDGILEIYGPEGVLQTADENGANQNEVIIFTPDTTQQLTIVVSGFQGSSGPFEIEIVEFP